MGVFSPPFLDVLCLALDALAFLGFVLPAMVIALSKRNVDERGNFARQCLIMRTRKWMALLQAQPTLRSFLDVSRNASRQQVLDSLVFRFAVRLPCCRKLSHLFSVQRLHQSNRDTFRHADDIYCFARYSSTG